MGFIWCDAGQPWDAWYKFLTDSHGLLDAENRSWRINGYRQLATLQQALEQTVNGARLDALRKRA